MIWEFIFIINTKNQEEVLFDKIKLRQEFLLKIYEFIQKFWKKKQQLCEIFFFIIYKPVKEEEKKEKTLIMQIFAWTYIF